MNCGGYRNSCAPRLMPYGSGVPSSYCSNPKYNCMGPCDGKKFVNVHLQQPVCTFPNPPPDNGDMKPCEPCQLPPINVNLKMCPEGTKFGPGGDCGSGSDEGGYMKMSTPSPVVADCCAGGPCGVCDYTPKKPRCVEMNYVEKTESMRPEYQYSQIPNAMDDRTTYRTYFDGKIGDPAKSCKPRGVYRYATGSGKHYSEYKHMYIPFQAAPYQKPPWAQKEEFKAVEGYMEGKSTYRADYQRLFGLPAGSAKPRPFMDPTRGPLEDRTTYKVDYPPHANCDRTRSMKPDPLLFVPTLGTPFSGQTMYKSDFVTPCLTTAKSYKPKRHQWLSNTGFDDNTTYKKAFLPFTYQKCKPIDNNTCYPFEERDGTKREFGKSTF